MPDMTITWKGAVSFDQFKGQSASSKAGAVNFDAAAMAAGFDIRPVHDANIVSVFADAMPYVSDDESSFEWADEYQQSVEEVVIPVSKGGRSKKGG